MPDASRSAPTITACPEAGLASILLRRGAAAAVSRAFQAQCRLDLPLPGRLTTAAGTALLWNGPDHFLAVLDSREAGFARELAVLLDGLAYVVEASSSRVVLSVAGDGAVEALNRLLPIDLQARVFSPGSVALTMAGHIAVQVWRPDPNSFRIACPSSLAVSFRRQLVLAGFGMHPPVRDG